MRKDYSNEDFAKRLIFEEMARSSPLPQQFKQNLETPGCSETLRWKREGRLGPTGIWMQC